MHSSLTFFERLANAHLALCKVLVALHVGEDAAPADPVVVMGAEEKDGELTNVMLQCLNVERDKAGITDFCGPPPGRQS